MSPTKSEINIKVFISYAHEDRDLRNKLEQHLSALKYSGEITVWQDQEIVPGDHWDSQIKTRLKEADMILLLVSSSFIASQYCWEEEVKAALDRHKAGTARVVPIILKSVYWKTTPLGPIQALPTEAKPVTRWDDQEAAWEDVVRGIHKLSQELRTLLQTEPQGSEVKKVPFTGRKAALIVGVNNTQCPSPLPNLKHAEDDAHEIAYNTLRKPDCNFVYFQTPLTGEKAKTQEVRLAIIELAQQGTTQDLLLFYFLGHALPIRTKEGYTDIYLVTSDFNEQMAIEDKSAYLSIRWLQGQLYRSDSVARVLIILDCCYSEKIVNASPDDPPVDLSQLLKECIGPSLVTEKNGRWKVVLTASTYTTPVQERMMTHLLVSALQGTVREAVDPKGFIHIPSLYTYLQKQMPQEQLPNLAEDFPQTCTLAHYPHLSEKHRLKDSISTKVSTISDQISEIHSLITDPGFFEKRAVPSPESPTEYFDHRIARNASFNDLDQEKITEFFKRDAVQREEHFRLGASSQDQLRYFGLLREGHPTYGALLCFGLSPTQWLPSASIRCTLWAGNDRNNGWLDIQDYQLDLIAQFDSSRTFLQKHLTREHDGDKHSEGLDIPLPALEEALANALMHREYMNRTDSVYIDIFDDRVEMTNPGTLPEPITLGLLKDEHKSCPRNPQIARIFYLHGYVKKVGLGIKSMQHALRDAGLQPAFFELGKDKTFKVIFSRPQQSSSSTIREDNREETDTRVSKPPRHSSSALRGLFQVSRYLNLVFRKNRKSIQCPRCRSLVRINPNEAQNPSCKSCNFVIPLAYARGYNHAPSVFIQLFGLPGAGKTMFLDMLRLYLYDMDQAWEATGFYAQPITQLDMEHKDILQSERSQGTLPGSTPKRERNQNEVYIMLLNHMVRWGSRFLVVVDHAGEQFGKLVVDVAEIPFLQHTPVTILLLSLPDLVREKKRVDNLINSYITSLEENGVNFAKEHHQLIIVFSKADLISNLPPELSDYLSKDTTYLSLKNQQRNFKISSEAEMDNYIRQMSIMSNVIRKWLEEKILGGATMLNMLKDKDIATRFTVMSATGLPLSGSGNALVPTPRRVLDPFFWVLEYYKSDISQTRPLHGKSNRNLGKTLALIGLIVIIVLSSIIGLVAYQNRASQIDTHATSTSRVITYPSYLPGNGTLAFSDPLNDGSTNRWETGNSSYGDCRFANGAYHVSATSMHNYQFCDASGSFSNFAFEVELTIIQGDCGGIVFRHNNGNRQTDHFDICQSGSYAVVKNVDNSDSDIQLLQNSNSPAINTGLNHTNTIAVVASSSTLTFYINQQRIDQVQDSSYTEGSIGLMAYSVNHATEVAYNHAKFWML